MSLIETCIVVPAYNEEKRLPHTLEVLAEKLTHGALGGIRVTEVLVVDDGSADATAAVAEPFATRLPGFRVIRSPRNFGKGHAVRQGLLNARAPWVLVADADMSTPWTEAAPLARTGAPIAIGSRDLKESKITRHQSFLRENLGKTFNLFVRTLTGLPFKDTQCGFKLIRLDAIEGFLSRLTVDRFAWDVELLMHADRAGLEIAEVPVVWEHKDDSRVSLLRDGTAMIWSVLKIRVALATRAVRRLFVPSID